ncbi:hypothetical protein [Flavivirga algicola]|uniref:DUF1571 domain-containing protein n=1 Tax=Flavivirga algicola TaxID=2729136 RepID=A0ABX1S0T0_9FLAO|nr:hypothetical protein [Flavivirga algicola]NMH89432.1 hypothetical protein [Flavivirga algicola]
MTHALRLTIIFSIFMLFFGGKKHQKQSPMSITRGLKPAIAAFTNLEQKLIIKVAKKLENNGFPIDQLTRIHLKKRIINDKDYYSYNEITFFINPAIYKQNEFNWGIENIGIAWEDPSVIRTPDGGIEFETGYKTKPENLVMTLYRLQDSYNYAPLLKNHNLILNKINDVLITNPLEEAKDFTSKGLFELIKNYLVILIADNENAGLYEMTIRRMDHDLIDFKHYNGLIEQYCLKININTSKVEILDKFDPTFFPTPVAPIPSKPFNKN